MLAQLLIRHYAVRDSKVFGMVISTGGQKSARGAYLFRFLKIECIQLILIKIKISYISLVGFLSASLFRFIFSAFKPRCEARKGKTIQVGMNE